MGNARETMLEDLEKFKCRPLSLEACLTDKTAPQVQRNPRPRKLSGKAPKWEAGLKAQFDLWGEDGLHAVGLDLSNCSFCLL